MSKKLTTIDAYTDAASDKSAASDASVDVMTDVMTACDAVSDTEGSIDAPTDSDADLGTTAAENEGGDGCKCKKREKYKNGGIRFGLFASVFEIAVFIVALIFSYTLDGEIGAAVVRDINVLFISINATLIGLYVTAFIFLNDSLKERVKDDPTLGEAVSSILDKYRRNMIWFSFGTIGSIVFEVISNITLGGDGREDLENWSIHTTDYRWAIFLIASLAALLVMTHIILCSKQITDSDGLIAEFSRTNLKNHEEKIISSFKKIKEQAEKSISSHGGPCMLFPEFDPSNPKNGISDEDNDEDYLIKIVNQHENLKVLDRIVPIDTDGSETADGSSLIPYFYSLMDTYNRNGRDILDDKFYETGSNETEIIFGKRARFLETIISKISENNIDKSIMKDKFIYDSMRSGYQWVYARKNASPSQRSPVQKSTIDIRDEKRFLDYVKFKLIYDPVFNVRPFNNKAIEKLFDKVSKEFKIPPINNDISGEETSSEHFKKKLKRIAAYKDEMFRIIDEFFTGYENVIGYRDALIHYRKYSESRVDNEECTCNTDKDEKASLIRSIRRAVSLVCKKIESKTRQLTATRRNSKAKNERNLVIDNIVTVNTYAELLIRVMVDRFTSFVKINDLNLGNSTFDKGWFNYSELSESNFTHSSFLFARIENAILKGCDLSTCNFANTDASETNFTNSNFSYSNLTGMDLRGALLNNAQMNNVILRDPLMDRYDGLAALFNKSSPSREDKETVKELKKWLSSDPGNEFKGSSFIKEIEDFVFDIHKKLKVENDDRSVTICDAIPDRLFENVMTAIAQLDKSHDSNKLPKRYFDKLTELRNNEAMRANTTDDGSTPENPAKKRREKSFGKISFGVACLERVSGDEVQLRNIDFSHVNMQEAALTNSDLAKAEMYYTNAKNILLSKCTLNDLDAYKTNFSNANFSEAKLLNSLFLNCNLSDAGFDKALLHHATFVSTLDSFEEPLYVRRFCQKRTDRDYILRLFEELVDEVAVGLDSEGREIRMSIAEATGREEEASALCSNATFSNILANNVSFININTMRSDFNQAMMKDCLIFNSLMCWCYFNKAKITNSLIIGTSFSHSNFEDAELSRAKIFGCEFTNAGFYKTKLISTSIAKSLFEHCDFEEANLGSSDIENCAFYNCNFANANLAGVTFKNCIFYNFDFSDTVELEFAQFTDCVFARKNYQSQNLKFISLDLKDFDSTKGRIKASLVPELGAPSRYTYKP